MVVADRGLVGIRISNAVPLNVTLGQGPEMLKQINVLL